MTTIKKLTVTTDAERDQWIELLKIASDYHYDMSGQFEPEIKSLSGDSKEEKVAQVHRAWGKAIQEAADLISMWDIEEHDDLITPRVKNVTPKWEDGRRWENGN